MTRPSRSRVRELACTETEPGAGESEKKRAVAIAPKPNRDDRRNREETSIEKEIQRRNERWQVAGSPLRVWEVGTCLHGDRARHRRREEETSDGNRVPNRETEKQRRNREETMANTRTKSPNNGISKIW